MMQLSVYKEHYKETIRLGVPIMLGQLGIIVVGFADNIMVGHHSTAELAAASFVNNFFNLVFIAGMGFSYGLTPIIGGYFAQKEYAKAGETLKNSLCINLIVGLLLSLCMLTLLLNIHILKQPEELMPYIVPYYILQLFSVIFAMLFNSFKQFSDGTTDTVTPMCVMLGANVLNIIGNYLLIYGNFGCPELGLTGAGISTLASRILTFGIFCVLFAKHSRYKLYREGFKKGTVNRANIGNLVRLGLPVGFQMGVETGSFSLSVIMMGWLGSTALAAHQVAGVITTLGFMVYYGIAAAVTIRVSNFRGRNDWPAIRHASFAGLHLVMGTAAIVVLLIGIFRNIMGYIITPEKDGQAGGGGEGEARGARRGRGPQAQVEEEGRIPPLPQGRRHRDRRRPRVRGRRVLQVQERPLVRRVGRPDALRALQRGERPQGRDHQGRQQAPEEDAGRGRVALPDVLGAAEGPRQGPGPGPGRPEACHSQRSSFDS